MRCPPPDARTSGVLFDRRDPRAASLSMNAFQESAEHLCPDDARLFGFESELERSLTYIPLAVRLKLDKCGIKLSLAQWNQFPVGNRWNLVNALCGAPAEVETYRRALCLLIRKVTGTEPEIIPTKLDPPWNQASVPDQVTRTALELGLAPPTPTKWRDLTELQRFALIKLTRDGRSRNDLAPALHEFGLL